MRKHRTRIIFRGVCYQSALMPGANYRRPRADVHPPLDFPGYRGTSLRHPRQPLVIVPQTLSELTGPVYGHASVTDGDRDLTNRGRG
ncbi:MAG: hypothetical protein ABI884_13630, partial [Gemmatimonadota bacterium]